MIVLDTCVLIAHFDHNDAHHAHADGLLTTGMDSQFGASPLTLAEFFVGPSRAGAMGLAQQGIQQLGVETIPLPEEGPARLASIRATTRLKLPDCCVLLAAEQTGSALATFDDRLAAAAREHELDVLGR